MKRALSLSPLVRMEDRLNCSIYKQLGLSVWVATRTALPIYVGWELSDMMDDAAVIEELNSA